MLNPDFDSRKYACVMLDMNGTFVLDFDNFGPGQDFGRTYREHYGALPAAEANRAVRAAYDHLAARYVDPDFYAHFPSVADSLRATGSDAYGEAVIAELVDTFALHEMGRLPTGYAGALATLSESRPLAVLSNLWAPPARWYANFERWGIDRLFRHVSFSSEGATIKPDPSFFDDALRALGLPAKRVLYVGDSYERDVIGARGVGMDAVWLTPGPGATKHAFHVGTAPDLPAFVNAISAFT